MSDVLSTEAQWAPGALTGPPGSLEGRTPKQ